MTDSDDTYLETTLSASDCTGKAAGQIIRPVAHALEEAPPEKRFDVEVEVTERD